jgi:hypothetical protein
MTCGRPRRFVYINRFIPEIYRRILLSGRWRAITGPLQISPMERIFKNVNSDANR